MRPSGRAVAFSSRSAQPASRPGPTPLASGPFRSRRNAPGWATATRVAPSATRAAGGWGRAGGAGRAALGGSAGSGGPGGAGRPGRPTAHTPTTTTAATAPITAAHTRREKAGGGAANGWSAPESFRTANGESPPGSGRASGRGVRSDAATGCGTSGGGGAGRRAGGVRVGAGVAAWVDDPGRLGVLTESGAGTARAGRGRIATGLAPRG